jgi:hypothetical protein
MEHMLEEPEEPLSHLVVVLQIQPEERMLLLEEGNTSSV